MLNSQHCDDWFLKLLRGLGRLKFGMSREEAAEFDSIYGVPDLILPDGNTVKESRQNSDLQITFIDNKLKEIFVILPLEQLCFAGKQIDGMEGFYIVEHTMKMMDETPVALDHLLVFQKACVYLGGFTSTYRDKVSVLWDYKDQDGCIIWQDGLRNQTLVFSKYIPVPPDPIPYH